MLQIEKIHIAFGETDLVEIDQWQIHPGQKVALVGPNGCGKSSLIRVLLQEELPRDGRVIRRSDVRVGYLPQQAVSGSTKTVWEEARSAMTRILALEVQIEELQQQTSAESQNQLVELLEAYSLAGGYNQEETIGQTLHGLGFAKEVWHNTCDSFSGGWQMRIALAKLLLSEPDVAILDEPTNHLDVPTKTWLAGHLQQVAYSILVVSHDHHFLDQFSSHVIEIRNKRLHTYTGNYTRFLQQRDQRIEQEQQAYEKQVAKAEHLQSYIDRFGAKATKARQAQSRKKQLEKLEIMEAPQGFEQRSKLRFAEAVASDYVTHELRKATVGWPNQAPLFKNVELRLERGMRLVLVGPNGCGKSTILKTLSGELFLQQGQRIVGEKIRLGIYAQDLAQHLPLDASPLQYIHEKCPTIGESEIRKVLGSLGLASNSHVREMQLLSGGEKARVVLAELSLNQYNVLFLDEPTNHLDTASSTAVADALSAFTGAVICISHEASFIEKVATHIGQCIGESVIIHQGFQAKYLECIQPKNAQKNNDDATKEYKAQQKERNRQQKIIREHKQVEEKIAQLEIRISELEAELYEHGSDLAKLQEITSTKTAVEIELENAMLLWEDLSNQIAG